MTVPEQTGLRARTLPFPSAARFESEAAGNYAHLLAEINLAQTKIGLSGRLVHDTDSVAIPSRALPEHSATEQSVRVRKG